MDRSGVGGGERGGMRYPKIGESWEDTWGKEESNRRKESAGDWKKAMGKAQGKWKKLRKGDHHCLHPPP